jgi:hypothetical protein
MGPAQAYEAEIAYRRERLLADYPTRGRTGRTTPRRTGLRALGRRAAGLAH